MQTLRKVIIGISIFLAAYGVLYVLLILLNRHLPVIPINSDTENIISHDSAISTAPAYTHVDWPPKTITVGNTTLSMIPIPEGGNSYFEGLYYKNDRDVYRATEYGTIVRIAGADPQTFTIDIPENQWYLEYAYDNHAVYYKGEKIFELSNPVEQFKILESANHKDCGSQPFIQISYDNGAKLVYWYNQLITGADADSFVPYSVTNFSKDKNHVYLGTTTTNYEPSSFDEMKASELCGMG